MWDNFIKWFFGIDLKLRGRMGRWVYFTYAVGLFPIHLNACRERLRAFEKFTGLKSSQIRHSESIIPMIEELRECREMYVDMMRERNKWKLMYENLVNRETVG